MLKKPGHLCAAQRLAQDDLSTSVYAVQLEDVLRDINADRDNLRHVVCDLSGSWSTSILARPTPVEGAIHDIRLTWAGDPIEAYVTDELDPSPSLCPSPLPG